MDNLFKSLSGIKKRLEQIESITENQTTVLLQRQEDERRLGILEEMFNYKNNLMNELEQIEQKFQTDYSESRSALENDSRLVRLQEEVGKVLKLKEKIMKIEQTNLILMKDKATTNLEQIKIQQTSQKVIESYKKHIRK